MEVSMRRATMPLVSTQVTPKVRDKRDAKRSRRRFTILENQLHSMPILSRDTPSVVFQRMLGPGNVEGFRHLEHSIVSRTLALECEYDRIGRPEHDEQVWKMLKKHNHLRVYKRTGQVMSAPLDHSRAGASFKHLPQVICVGSIEGKVEDILYGLHAKTRSEMGAILTFMGRTPLDCDVLAEYETGTDHDPFRQLSIKYLLAETFGDVRFINNRDICALESMGFGLDAQGRRYGYYLLRSVDVAQCTPLPDDSGVVRASVTMCCIYRQVQGAVNIYSKAMIDLGGSLPAFMAYNAAKELLLLNAEAIKSATAKRLTLLALQTKSCPTPALTDSWSDSRILMRSASRSVFNGRSSKSSLSSTEVPSLTESARWMSHKVAIQRCSICDKKPSRVKIVHSNRCQCGVCHRAVCSKCSIKQTLYARMEPMAVICCKVCIVAAKKLHVDPREPLPMLP